MDSAEFEKRFLDFVYRTETVITAGAVAYYVKSTIDEAQSQLERLAVRGTISLESDDHGNVYFVYPNRQKLPAPSTGLVPAGPQALAQQAPPATYGGTPPHGQPAYGAATGGSMQVGGFSGPTYNTPVPEATLNPDGSKNCPFCGESILAVARKCKHCNTILDAALRSQLAPVQVNVGLQQATPTAMARPTHSPGVAACLSFIWPGLGQMYTGRIGAGLGWMVGTILGYAALVIPGLILHVLCIFSAANDAKKGLPPAR